VLVADGVLAEGAVIGWADATGRELDGGARHSRPG
jgi:hypothetical protein